MFHDGLWHILASSVKYASGIDLPWGRGLTCRCTERLILSENGRIVH